MQEDMNNRNIEFLLFNRNERFENERKFYSFRQFIEEGNRLFHP